MSADLVLNHRYRLLERLAVGGMGEVWRASDASLGRQVAVKLLRLELVSDATALRRFESEAEFAAGLRHRGIARVFDFGEQDGRMYLVMELVPGEPLDEILVRDGGLPLEAVLDLLVQAGRALTVAHEAGIVHRDVKPANLMISPDGTLKITDFGIARRLEAASQTATGMVMGTAHYISPEQASGQPISPAADLYSLGVVAYECLTGMPPFDGRTPVEIALKHVKDEPPELPAHVPAKARALVAALLAKAPRDRPADANAVADWALEVRASLSTGRSARPGEKPGVTSVAPTVGVTTAARPDDTGQTSVLSGFDAGAGADNLTKGIDNPGQKARAAGGRRRLTYASVAAGLLLVGCLVIGSLWKGLAFAGSGEERDAPQNPATGPAGGEAQEDPVATPSTPSAHQDGGPAPTVTRRHGTRRIRPSTPGAGSASPEHKRTRKPPRATPSAPDPTPTPTGSTTTPSTPSPDPSPTPGGELGSEDKV
ncbi:serine/threonine-protein kinase [Actinomadura sp. NEAU-AAG7]|uniref:serine/threonine-protein kinase n=1 Tax=Actinomadura sp. NEAU-AAG7 TaxID=2839640 RepID=UPI001BE4CD9D|nr:serine/threonine-protein kinase [Actinomadura sp. NEAU-AAG7]MBT2207080.1 serine/threonine protein kinase [Actinomadura sp. NEAU-AAG7]